MFNIMSYHLAREIRTKRVQSYLSENIKISCNNGPSCFDIIHLLFIQNKSGRSLRIIFPINPYGEKRLIPIQMPTDPAVDPLKFPGPLYLLAKIGDCNSESYFISVHTVYCAVAPAHTLSYSLVHKYESL